MSRYLFVRLEDRWTILTESGNLDLKVSPMGDTLSNDCTYVATAVLLELLPTKYYYCTT